jgi:hypothetical protein
MRILTRNEQIVSLFCRITAAVILLQTLCLLISSAVAKSKNNEYNLS